MPESLLLPGEVVLFATRRHVFWLIVPLVLIITATVLLAVRACPIALELHLNGGCPLVMSAGFAAAALPFVLEWVTTRFILTNYRLIRLQAPVWLRSREFSLPAIHGLSVQQSLLGRLFGYGDLFADTAARRGGRIVLDFVPDPLRLRDEISAALWAAGEE